MNSFYPSRKLGQNFTVDQSVIAKTCRLIKSLNPTALIEVGPGKGALTKALLKLRLPYHGIELDKRLAEYLLVNEILTEEQLTIGDALKQNLDQYFPDTIPLLCGNIPYSISSPLIANFLASKLQQFVLVCQWEFGQRLVAPVNSPNYSAFGVFCQYHLQIKSVFKIDKVAFKPKPQVDSVLMLLKKKPQVAYEAHFGRFLKQCFHQRRKLLVNNLKQLLPPTLLTNVLQQQDLAATVRAQELTPTQLFRLYLSLKPHLSDGKD